jgi:hypothetical protein
LREERVRLLLERAAPPGELDAERRAWALVRRAYAEREPVRAPRFPSRVPVALAAALALVVAGLTPPGRAVTSWVRDAIAPERVPGREDARPALASLPSPGRLLVVSKRGLWVVREDGSRRRLGAYADATWSPHGLHVAATRGRQLVAMRPDGDVRWTLSRGGRIVSPRWSPSGYRIAYGVGPRLRVVAGDGAPDRGLAANVVPGAWAWRPDARRNVLAEIGHPGVVRVLDVDTRELLWSWWRRLARGIRALAWAADGSRLVAHDGETAWVLDARGRTVARHRLGAIAALAPAPRGRVVAAVVRGAERSRVVVFRAGEGVRPRVVFAGAGRLGDLAWSPDGRWLLVTWPSADQWLFLRMPRVRQIVAVSNLAREFDPGGAGGGSPRSAARLRGWCC